MTKETKLCGKCKREKPCGCGRPSEYSEEKLAKAMDYLVRHVELKDPVPTVEGLCDELEVSKPTVYAWSEANPEFLNALERIKVKQGRLLQSSGLESKFAPAITKLMLSANHGMAEKNDVTSGGEKLSGFIQVPAKKEEGVE